MSKIIAEYPARTSLQDVFDSNKIIELMRMDPGDCRVFYTLYKGMLLEMNALRPNNVAMADATDTANGLWDIHRPDCFLGSISAHFPSGVMEHRLSE